MQGKTSVVIFGGTSEGRELAEYAEKQQIPVMVSVVSGYGENLLKESDMVQIHTGALDESAMRQFLQETEPKLVLDATHPYARVVTKQVADLCRDLEVPYRRVLRGSEETNLAQTDAAKKKALVFVVDSLADAVQYLKQDDRPVLLTTGSKELEAFAADPNLRERIYARVLPDSQVLKKCEDLGLCGAHVIAMQGPFSTELNSAILRTVKAGWIVTKEAGKRGGFVEKMEAARQCGASVVVIRRPVVEEGISLEEAKLQMDVYRVNSSDDSKIPDMSQNLQQRTTISEPDENRQPDSVRELPSDRIISMIGMGMGGGKQLTLEALEVLKHSDIVFGASRMLSDLAPFICEKPQKNYYQPGQILDWLNEHKTYRHAVVICSGDTGFYSGSGSMMRELEARFGKKQTIPYVVKVYPGISSVSALAARFKISWEDACLASAHGRECDVTALLKAHDKVFLLLDGSMNVRQICRILVDAGMGDTTVYAGVRMGYEDECAICGRAEELINVETNSLAAVFLERKHER